MTEKLNTEMSADAFFKKVKSVSIGYAEVPPMAEYEIRWASKDA